MDDRRSIPSTLEEARKLRRELADKVTELSALLTNKDMTHPRGRRLSSVEYWQWKKGVQNDLTETLKRLRLAKEWLHNLQQATSNSPAAKAEREAHRNARRSEFVEFLIQELESGLNSYIEYRKQGLPEIDCRIAVLDELRRRCEDFPESNADRPVDSDESPRN